MNDKDPQTLVDRFLQQYLNPLVPVVIGLSGGPDSMALLQMLIDYRQRCPLQLHAAHVDHGWRSESVTEAQELNKLCQQYELPLHVEQLHMDPTKKNLEDVARQQRIVFFRKLTQKLGAQAVLLAHHRNDQAETVLKRVLEGASLTRLYGMRPVSIVHGVTLWRPLLAIRKTTLEEWLQARDISYFLDPSNQNSAFLRARLRYELLPYLESIFKKNVVQPLGRTAEASLELESYLDQQTQPFLHNIYSGPWGCCLDLSNRLPVHTVELRHLLRRFLDRSSTVISTFQMSDLMQLLKKNCANAATQLGMQQLLVDRKRVFQCFQQPTELPNSPLQLQEGDQQFGSWKIRVEESVKDVSPNVSGWQAVWQGKLVVYLPAGKWMLQRASKTLRMPLRNHATLDSLWTQQKVPAFLREAAPIFIQEGQVCVDVLSHSFPAYKNPSWRVSLDIGCTSNS